MCSSDLADRQRRVAAARFAGKVRAIKVGAEDSRSLGALLLESAAEIQKNQVLLVTRHRGRRQETGGPMVGMRPANGLERGLGPVHEVGPAAAVNVQIHVAGDKIVACQINGRHGRAGARER